MWVWGIWMHKSPPSPLVLICGDNLQLYLEMSTSFLHFPSFGYFIQHYVQYKKHAMLNTQQQQVCSKFKTACWTCRGRKVKCDKNLPCRNCVQGEISCSFPPQVRTVQRPKTARRRDSKEPGSQNGSDLMKDETILDRLNRLEALLKKQSSNIRLDGTSDGFNTDSDEDGGENGDGSDNISFGQRKRKRTSETHPNPSKDQTLINHFTPMEDDAKGQWNPSTEAPQTQQKGFDTQYLADEDVNYWKRLEEDCASQVFFKPPSATKSSCAGKRTTSPPVDQSNMIANDIGFSFPFPQLSGPTLPPLLSVLHRQICWSKYVENVDPLLKILHTPTMEGFISLCDVHEFGLNYPMVALVQAVCLLAITSMSEEEVSTLLESKKETMLRTCASLTEQTLIAANFLDAQDLNTVQALLLYLYYLKYMEDTRLHSLCSVATYLASRMGLNRDGATLGLSRLQVELRRRTWWQLIILVDHPDASPFESLPHTVGADTRLPLNVDDSQLDHQEAYATEDGTGFTESSFCLMQYEITRTFNQIKVDRAHTSDDRIITIEGAEQRLHSSRQVMESRYFEDSIKKRPICDFAANVVAMILAKRRILMHIPGRDNRNGALPQDSYDNLFLLGIHVLELSRGLQTMKNFEKWRWLNTTYFQWAIASFVLKDLAVRPRTPATKRAWHALDGILDHWPASTQNSAKAVALKILMADAIRNRESDMLWNSSLTSGLGNNNRNFQPSSETARYDIGDMGRRKETPPGWMNNPLLPKAQQIADFSSLSHAMDVGKYGVPDLMFDQNDFNFNFRHLN